MRIEEGLTFVEIGERLGITRQWASSLFGKWMQMEIDATREVAGQARDVEVARIDRLWKIAWDDATDMTAGTEDRARSMNVCIRLSERRSKLLGLDSPEKHEHTGKDGGPIDMNTTFDLSGLEGNALDKELAGFFNPGYMEGAADGFAAGKKAGAKKGGAKKKAARGKKESASDDGAKVAQQLPDSQEKQETPEPPATVVNVATGERARTQQSKTATVEVNQGQARV